MAVNEHAKIVASNTGHTNYYDLTLPFSHYGSLNYRRTERPM